MCLILTAYGRLLSPARFRCPGRDRRCPESRAVHRNGVRIEQSCRGYSKRRACDAIAVRTPILLRGRVKLSIRWNRQHWLDLLFWVLPLVYYLVTVSDSKLRIVKALSCGDRESVLMRTYIDNCLTRPRNRRAAK
jgi:hypothetical protein